MIDKLFFIIKKKIYIYLIEREMFLKRVKDLKIKIKLSEIELE
jgi:hypothetical protein